MQPLSETEPLLCYLQYKSIYLLIFLIIFGRKRIPIGNDFTRLTFILRPFILKKAIMTYCIFSESFVNRLS